MRRSQRFGRQNAAAEILSMLGPSLRRAQDERFRMAGRELLVYAPFETRKTELSLFRPACIWMRISLRVVGGLR
jgi:hypothetical protein